MHNFIGAKRSESSVVSYCNIRVSSNKTTKSLSFSVNKNHNSNTGSVNVFIFYKVRKHFYSEFLFQKFSYQNLTAPVKVYVCIYDEL